MALKSSGLWCMTRKCLFLSTKKIKFLCRRNDRKTDRGSRKSISTDHDVGHRLQEVPDPLVPGRPAPHEGAAAVVRGVFQLGEVRGLDPLGNLEN